MPSKQSNLIELSYDIWRLIFPYLDLPNDVVSLAAASRSHYFDLHHQVLNLIIAVPSRFCRTTCCHLKVQYDDSGRQEFLRDVKGRAIARTFNDSYEMYWRARMTVRDALYLRRKWKVCIMSYVTDEGPDTVIVEALQAWLT